MDNTKTYRVRFLKYFKDGNILPGQEFLKGNTAEVTENEFNRIVQSGGMLSLLDDKAPTPKKDEPWTPISILRETEEEAASRLYEDARVANEALAAAKAEEEATRSAAERIKEAEKVEAEERRVAKAKVEEAQKVAEAARKAEAAKHGKTPEDTAKETQAKKAAAEKRATESQAAADKLSTERSKIKLA